MGTDLDYRSSHLKADLVFRRQSDTFTSAPVSFNAVIASSATCLVIVLAVR